MKKDPKVFLVHILKSIELIEGYTKKRTKEEFNKSVQLQDSVIRRLEIIGEAAKALPESFKKKHTSIPWKKIGGMRDILIHKYFGVDLDLTWEVVVKELPQLKEKIEKLV